MIAEAGACLLGLATVLNDRKDRTEMTAGQK